MLEDQHPNTPNPTPIVTPPANPVPTPTTPTTTPNQTPPTTPTPPSARRNTPSLKLGLLMYILGIVSGVSLFLAFPNTTNNMNQSMTKPTPTIEATSPTTTQSPSLYPMFEASPSAMQGENMMQEATPSASL